ncbi:hypothetical protein MYX84_07165, partial [Acidobacteria bacterium AH-259-O06]|nr:hypothetical protein [Acidobacteria bacterium AH-259-O06]
SMFCLEVNATAAAGTQSLRGGSDQSGKQMWRPEHKEIPATAKDCPVLKSLHGCCEEPTRRYLGKADDLWEETSTSTADITVVWGQASTERYAEITSGRTISQQGLATTCKDRPYKVRSRKQEEGSGLTHGLVGAKKVGQRPLT